MTPILYSFRRCPYAMRARLALASAQVECELREIVLRDKAPEFLTASAKGTVPVLVLPDRVIDESIDVMHWALIQNDPEHWRDMPPEATALIAQFDGPFKTALDRTKYASRYPDQDMETNRAKAAEILLELDELIGASPWIYGDTPTQADMATLPFVRQFAMIDKVWFDAQPWGNVIRWLDAFLASDRFAAIMTKYPKWQAGDPPTAFPPAAPDTPHLPPTA